MKLVKIFSNKNFKNVDFNPHFNVVLATIFDTDNKKDTHNLGKTSLIHVINFLLLGKFDKKKDLLGNDIFTGQEFFIELELNNGNFLVIKRAVDSSTKISFKLNEIRLGGFTPPTEWDKKDIPFDKSRELLNEYLGFDVLTKWDFRKSITYFLRTQQDFLDVYKLNKFQGKHITWKPFVFELLGFNGELIENKLKLEEEAEQNKQKIEILKKEAKVDVKERDKLMGLIDIKDQEKKEAESTIDKFNFFTKDSEISKDVIENLDFQIQTLNTERYRIGYEISKIEESLRESINEVDLKKLKQLFDEVEIHFPDTLTKRYADLEKFNAAISKERKKYLSENLTELKAEFKRIGRDISFLELDKSEKLSFLTEKDTYTKFKGYQKLLSKVEAEIERLRDKVTAIDHSVEIEGKIKELNTKIDDATTVLTNAITLRNHAEINKTFNQIIHDILGTNALISITQNGQGNIEFDASYQNPDDLNSTSEAQGTTYKKILCMAFDLSLLIHYSKSSFYKFVYHDGILEGLDNRIKLRLLEKVKSICSQYDIQYVLSLIDSDIPTLNDGSKYIFNQNEICLELNDKDDSGKLFLQSF